VLYKQSQPYWKNVLFQEENKIPTNIAAAKRLKKPYSQFFSHIRKEILALKGVEETIRYMGPTWAWTWVYEYEHEKLLFLHPHQEGLSATFIVSYGEESKILNAPNISADIKQSIRLGRNARNVRWVWLDLKTEQRMEDLLETIRFKYQLLTTLPKEEPEEEPAPALTHEAHPSPGTVAKSDEENGTDGRD